MSFLSASESALPANDGAARVALRRGAQRDGDGAHAEVREARAHRGRAGDEAVEVASGSAAT